MVTSRCQLAESGDHGNLRQVDDFFRLQVGGLDLVDVLSELQQAECFHHFGDIDSARASDHTGVAGGADPGGVGFRERLDVAQLGQCHELAREDIDVVGHRAGTGAGAALVALADILAGDFHNLFAKLLTDGAW